MRTSEGLKAAKQYLVEHGWVRHKLHAADGRVCMVGAIFASNTDIHHGDIIKTDMYRYLQRVTRFHWVPAWNDGVAKSAADVYDAFDRAIALAEEDEYYGSEPTGLTAAEAVDRLDRPGGVPSSNLLGEDCENSQERSTKVLVGS